MKDRHPNPNRIWVCQECGHVFSDDEIRKDIASGAWGHACKHHPCRKGQRCESFLIAMLPEAK